MYTLSHNPSANYCFGKTPPLDLILNQARNIFRKIFKVLYSTWILSFHNVQNFLSFYLLSKTQICFQLRTFESSVLRKISGYKKEEVTVGQTSLRNAESDAIYNSPNIIGAMKSRKMELLGHVARLEDKRNVYRIQTRKHESKSETYRPRFGRVDKI